MHPEIKYVNTKIPKNYFRLRDTGRIHKGKKTGRITCKIFVLIEIETKYTCEKLLQLRAERGIGNSRKFNKGATQ